MRRLRNAGKVNGRLGGAGGRCSCPGGLTALPGHGEDDTAAVASRGRLWNLERASRAVCIDNGYAYDVVSCRVMACRVHVCMLQR